MTQETDHTEEVEATPSQAALDVQLRQQGSMDASEAAARSRGGRAFARGQIMDRIQDGRDRAVGRDLLGRLDQMEEFPDIEDPTINADFREFVYGAGAASVSQPAASAPKQEARTRQAAPRPSTPASRARDNQRLLDPNTPIAEIKKIRDSQKAGG